jgi:hypothetical protein
MVNFSKVKLEFLINDMEIQITQSVLLLHQPILQKGPFTLCEFYDLIQILFVP